MNKLMSMAALLTVGAATSTGMAQTGGRVCFDLRLTVRDGTVVRPGTSVGWVIEAFVSTGDNQGLAMALVDLEQSPDNPEVMDLGRGSTPSTMKDFDLPRGIANRGEGNTSGYGGRKVPPTSPRESNKLIQIGGAQNNFGVVGITGFAQDTQVESGIGQSPAGQIISSGKLVAPSRCGTYKIYLSKPLANTLVYVQPAPGFSEVAPARIQLCDGVAYFTVSEGCLRLDLDDDGTVGPSDLYTMVAAVVAATGEVEPGRPHRADLNHDGLVNGEDLFHFIDAMLRGEPAADATEQPEAAAAQPE